MSDAVPMTAREVLARRNEGQLMHELYTRGYAIRVGQPTDADKAARRSPPIVLYYAGNVIHIT